MCPLRPSSFIVLMELHVTRLVHDGPSTAGLELGHHIPRRRNLRRAFPHLFLKMDVFGTSEFPQVIFSAEIRLQMLSRQPHSFLNRLSGKHFLILHLESARRSHRVLHACLAALLG